MQRSTLESGDDVLGWKRHDKVTGRVQTVRLWGQTGSMTLTSQRVRQPFSLVFEVI